MLWILINSLCKASGKSECTLSIPLYQAIILLQTWTLLTVVDSVSKCYKIRLQTGRPKKKVHYPEATMSMWKGSSQTKSFPSFLRGKELQSGQHENNLSKRLLPFAKVICVKMYLKKKGQVRINFCLTLCKLWVYISLFYFLSKSKKGDESSLKVHEQWTDNPQTSRALWMSIPFDFNTWWFIKIAHTDIVGLNCIRRKL